jgi:hypothetical protein
MAVGFVGFIDGTSALALWGKIVPNTIVTVLILWLASKVRAPSQCRNVDT